MSEETCAVPCWRAAVSGPGSPAGRLPELERSQGIVKKLATVSKASLVLVHKGGSPKKMNKKLN